MFNLCGKATGAPPAIGYAKDATHVALFNDNTKTDIDATRLSFVTPTGIDQLHSRDIKIYNQGNKLIIEGLSGETISIYSIIGTLIESAITNSNQFTTQLPTKSMYIVKIGSKTVKVRM